MVRVRLGYRSRPIVGRPKVCRQIVVDEVCRRIVVEPFGMPGLLLQP